MCEINADHVLGERPRSPSPSGGEGGPRSRWPTSCAALEMLYKHLGLGDGAREEGVVIVDE